MVVLTEKLKGWRLAVPTAQMWADHWASLMVAPMVDQMAETKADWWADLMELRRVEYLERYWVAHSVARKERL